MARRKHEHLTLIVNVAPVHADWKPIFLKRTVIAFEHEPAFRNALHALVQRFEAKHANLHAPDDQPEDQ